MRSDLFVDLVLKLRQDNPEDFQEKINELIAEYKSTLTPPEEKEADEDVDQFPIAVYEYVCPTCSETNQIAWHEGSISKNTIFTFDRVPFYLWIRNIVGREHFCQHCNDRIAFHDPFFRVWIDTRRHVVPKFALSDTELEALDSLQHEVLKAYAGMSEYEIRYRDPKPRSKSQLVRVLSDGDTAWGSAYLERLSALEQEKMREEAEEDRMRLDIQSAHLYEKKQERYKRKANLKKPKLAKNKQ